MHGQMGNGQHWNLTATYVLSWFVKAARLKHPRVS